MLATKLVLFDVFLKRTDTVPEGDKEKVLQKMDQFADLMAQSPFVQKQSAKARMEGKEQGILEGRAIGKELGKAEGKAEGKVEGQIGMLQSNILKIVYTRFPQLTETAQEKVCQLSNLKTLDDLFNKLLVATDNEAARLILDALAA